MSSVSKKIDAIIEIAKKDDIEAKFWTNGHLNRVYAKTQRRDAKVFLDLEIEGQHILGAALKIQMRDCGQSSNWYVSQKQILRENYAGLFHAYVIATHDEDISSCGHSFREMIEDAVSYFEELDE